LMAVWLRPFLKSTGADEALYYHDGLVSECPRANVFIVDQKNCLCTPARGVLAGITRNNILKIGKELMDVEERDIPVEELRAAQEIFISSTTKQVLPVTRINGEPIGTGTAGPVAVQLKACYERLL
jgi:branched-chain amino acid aminotransferase